MSTVEHLERHQVAIYLAALAAGGALGLAWPWAAPAFGLAIQPVLGALLFATFLQVPLARLGEGLRDVRFLVAVLVVNFVVVPLVVAGLTAVVTLERAVLLGVLLTLLTPCIDYVIVFTGLAGGDSQRLVAASPLLLLVQMAALPLLLWLFVGPALAAAVEVGPFLAAFGFLLVVPLGLAWLTQSLAVRHRAGRVVSAGMTAAMVPLMAATLCVVVASQVTRLQGRYAEVASAVPVLAGFLVAMVVVGVLAARVSRLDPPRARALVFSGVTRNSLVVLPLALSLPAAYAVTPAVVVSQTLVELVGMLVLVRLVPRLVPSG